MARENNAMSPADLRAFLATVEWMALGVLDAGGGPAASVVPVAVQDDFLYFAVEPGSSAEACLARAPRSCVTADVFPSYYEIKGGTVHGKAQLVGPDHSVKQVLDERARRHRLPGGSIYALPLLDDAFGFDFAKLARR
jgi:nitroimidazol reductase NimA-like FMN-containing flavoprotein (pyridoxamine 5'-phosphate oxidase superfamily)